LVKSILSKYFSQDEIDAFLTDVSVSDLQKVYAYILSSRRNKSTIRKIKQDYKNKKLCYASSVDQNLAMRLDLAFFDFLGDDCKYIELSPFLPLGTINYLSEISPFRILQTVKSLEISSEATVGLCLWIATHEIDSRDISIATSQRVVRIDSKESDFSPAHYRTFNFVMASSIGEYRKWLDQCIQRIFDFIDFIVSRIIKTNIDNYIIVLTVKKDHAFSRNTIKSGSLIEDKIRIVEDPEMNYYESTRISLKTTNSGKQMTIADGGDVNWLSVMSSNNRKKAFVFSVSSERIALILRSKSK
jgi:hypothetical protein